MYDGVLSQAIVFLVVGEMSSQYDAAIVLGPGIVLFFCPRFHQSPILTAVYSRRAASVGGCVREYDIRRASARATEHGTMDG